MKFLFLLSFILLLVNLSYCQAGNTKNKIESLPGINSYDFDMYSGYVTVNTTYERSLFYWLLESQNDPANDPVVLWLQGGPGCAGTWAIFQEHGAFQINVDNSLSLNYYSWNKNANVIYIDSPAGVGYSYSNTSEGLNTNDNQTAADTYNFLLGFFELFPNFNQNDLWITGESYGGVYVPTLVNNIVDGNSQMLKNNLQGFMIGNPVTQCQLLDHISGSLQIDLFYNHGTIPFSLKTQWYNNGCDQNEKQVECVKLLESAYEINEPFNVADLYFNECTGNGTINFFDEVENCYSIGARTPNYLNRPDVIEAIHAKLGINNKLWLGCGGVNYTQNGRDMNNYYNKFFNLEEPLDILIYSGDVDIANVPHTFTQLCLAELNRKSISPWKRWTIQGPTIPKYVPNYQEKSQITAGFVEHFDKYTYATVRGAGHEVPMYQPHQAYELFNRFIIQRNF